MKLSPLSDGHVVAGARGLDQEIGWVQVVDHPDIERWVEAGHLLLSTGFNWPKKGRKAAQLVEKLAAKGVCGVVLAVPEYLEHFPTESLEAATRLGFPLIEVPWEVPFSTITQSVHRALLESQGEALVRSEQIHRQLTEAAVAADGLEDVAKVLGSVLSQSVLIVSTEGAELASFSGPSAMDGGMFEELQNRGAIRTMSASTRAVRWRPRPSRLTTAIPGVVGYAIRIRNEPVGFVLVADTEGAISDLDLRAVEQAGTVAALQISHQRALTMQETRMGYALVASLVEGTFDEKPGNLERAALMGWERSKRYRLAAVLLDEPNPLTTEGFAKRENIAAEIKGALTRMSEPALISVSANQVLVLLPEKVQPSDLWVNIAHGRAAMGISEPHKGVAGMKAAGQEVADIMEHLLPGRIQSFDEILFPRVMSGDASARKLFLSRVFEPLGKDNKGLQLFETASALSEEGFHLQNASERLGVHISTLRARMVRLAEVTGLDLESVEGRFRLQVGVRLQLMTEL